MMKKSVVLVIVLSVLAALSFGCHKKQPAADEGGRPAKKSRAAKAAKESTEATETKSAPVKGAALYVIIDRNINKSMTDYEIKNRNQVGDWMDDDLIALLKKAGFKAQLIKSRAGYPASSGAHLLVVRITNYNPGSKAARMVVGFGAGAASMNTHYDLYGSGSSPILSDDLGVGSGRDWRNVIRKINEQTVKAVLEKLGK